MRSEGHYTKRSGIANAGASEVAYLCWLGRQPSLSTKSRMHVDPGTDVYVDFMSKVPLQPDRDLLKVDLATKEKIFPGDGEHLPEPTDAESEESDEEDGTEQAKRNYPKRNSGRALFRAASNPENTVCLGHWFCLEAACFVCVCVRCEDN